MLHAVMFPLYVITVHFSNCVSVCCNDDDVTVIKNTPCGYVMKFQDALLLELFCV